MSTQHNRTVTSDATKLSSLGEHTLDNNNKLCENAEKAKVGMVEMSLLVLSLSPSARLIIG